MKRKNISQRQKNDHLPAGLYLVATPIGNLQDITLRAIDILKNADEIWCEDTRESKKLLQALNIPIQKPLRACHDHNEMQMATWLIDKIQDNQSIAYVSDAGMPVINDPGFRLIQTAIEADLPYTVLPGASAVPTALALSGMPSHHFGFFGFFPNKSSARKKFFEELKPLKMTIIGFETAHRLSDSLEDAATVFGSSAQCAIVREISKTFEDMVNGTLDELINFYQNNPPKGEIVVLFDRNQTQIADDYQVETALLYAMKTLSTKDAVKLVSDELQRPRKEVYAIALNLNKN